jgi:hypothetical protein
VSVDECRVRKKMAERKPVVSFAPPASYAEAQVRTSRLSTPETDIDEFIEERISDA